jgi:Cu+-exporting ATPase
MQSSGRLRRHGGASADFTADRARRADDYAHQRRLFWIAAALTLPLVAQMGWMLGGPHTDVLPRWFQLLLATPVQFWIGWRFYAGAWHALRGGGANMDVLVALGTSALFSAAVACSACIKQSISRPAPQCTVLMKLSSQLTSAAIRQLCLQRGVPGSNAARRGRGGVNG